MSSNTSIAHVPLSLAATAVLAAAAALGCAGPSEKPVDPNAGQLVMALTQIGPHGEIFRLNNAVFEIIHTDNGSTEIFDATPFDGAATVDLAPGVVTVELLDGWALEKSTDGGLTFQPASALLGSPNPNTIRILANQPVFMEVAFLIRQTDGTLAITLGVDLSPRELAGGMVVQSATGSLAGYAVGGARSLDFAVYFKLFSLQSMTLPDGTKQRVYTAFGQQGSLGPVPLPSTALAAEFFNDDIGTIAGTIGPSMTGGALTYTVSAKPDGTVELSGQLFGRFTEIDFGPNAIDAIIPTLDTDGFPNDEFFYDMSAPFTLTAPDVSTATGLLRIRQLLPAP
jgi:hypothetical protein